MGKSREPGKPCPKCERGQKLQKIRHEAFSMREQYQADEAGESLVVAKRAGVDGRRDVLGPDAGKTLVGMNLTMSGDRGWTKRSHCPGAEPLLVLG